MSEKLMTIRQMCEAFGVTPRTLRFYEARELIFPERRGQHRLYDRRDRARLTLIAGFGTQQGRAAAAAVGDLACPAATTTAPCRAAFPPADACDARSPAARQAQRCLHRHRWRRCHG